MITPGFIYLNGIVFKGLWQDWRHDGTQVKRPSGSWHQTHNNKLRGKLSDHNLELHHQSNMKVN